MNYIDITIDNKHYIQRNEFSKITETDKNGKKLIFDSTKQLPRYIQEAIEDYLKVKINPDKYFIYEDISNDEIMITEYINNDDIKTVAIPECINGKKVTKLGSIFDFLPVIERITMPDSITSLSECFCTSCRNLGEVHLSPNIKELPSSCFASCSGLEKINLENIEKIRTEALANCFLLDNLNLDNLKEIDIFAFCWCKSLSEINAPNLEYINDYAFSCCEELRKVRMGNKVLQIGRGAFEKCYALNDIILPDTLLEINENTFRTCQSLKAINMPKKLTKIHWNAFKNSGLTSVSFPDTLKVIKNHAFEGTDLEEINISKNTYYEQFAFSLNHLLKIKVYDTPKEKIKNFFLQNKGRDR